MWRIIPRLYLGDWQDACHRPQLRKFKVTHILNCAYELPCHFRRGFEYLHVELHDPDPDFSDYIPEICDFITAGRRHGGVLVHCQMGMSRSPSAILAYICSRGRTLQEGLRLLRKAVGEDDEFVEPNPVFLEQLRDYFPSDVEGEASP